jgi:hypothetical protein
VCGLQLVLLNYLFFSLNVCFILNLEKYIKLWRYMSNMIQKTEKNEKVRHLDWVIC